MRFGPPVELGVSFNGVGLFGEGEASRGKGRVEVLEAGEAFVGDRLTDERPQAFGRLQLGAVGRQEDQPDALGHVEGRAPMPAGLIEDEDHRFGPAGATIRGKTRQHGRQQGGVDGAAQEPFDRAAARMDEAVEGEPFIAGMDGGDRPLATGRPDPAECGFQPRPVLVEGPDLDRPSGMPRTLLLDRRAQPF